VVQSFDQGTANADLSFLPLALDSSMAPQIDAKTQAQLTTWIPQHFTAGVEEKKR
jgi:hypothetical protein